MTTSGAITVGTTALVIVPRILKGTSVAMIAGSVTISANIWLVTGCVIAVSANTAGGTPGTLKAAAGTRTAGAPGTGQFIITSSGGSDTSTVDWVIYNVS